VGSLGEQLESLASFALFLAGYEAQSVDFSKESIFVDGMKSLFRQAGLEGKPIGVIIKVSCDKLTWRGSMNYDNRLALRGIIGTMMIAWLSGKAIGWLGGELGTMMIAWLSGKACRYDHYDDRLAMIIIK
jgi:hypothetical protein